MSDTPVYTSPCTAKSLWHEYRIYEDHLELETGPGPMQIPFEHLERVELSPSILSREGLRLHLQPRRVELKLDFADFSQHIMLDRDTGLIRRVDFTPQDRAEFKRVVDGTLRRFQEKPGSPARLRACRQTGDDGAGDRTA